MNIAVVGLSHKTAPVEIREKLSISDLQTESAIAYLCDCPHIEEVTILSTCNRLEIYSVLSETDSGTQEIVQFLSEHSNLPLDHLYQHLFILLHREAVMHLMQVASGLDSLVLGEGQILAQVKHAYTLGQQYKGIKSILNQLFKQAISAGKRVRNETSISTGAVSVSSAAVELAQTKVQNLSNSRVTIVGAGKMARRLLQHLLSKGVNQISIVNRSIEKAQDLVNEFSEAQVQCYSLAEMMSLIAASDLVFTCTAATEPLLNRAKLETALKLNQSLMLFDISVPRNIDANANELAHVQVFNVDDLKIIVLQNTESRRAMALEAQMLLEDELEAFRTWWHSRETVPIISCLRQKVEAIREQELQKALSRLGNEASKKHQEVVEALTRGIVNKILHEPIVHLRKQQDIEAQRVALQTLQALFNLEIGEQYDSVAKTLSRT